MRIFGIESSCDETACAVVDNGIKHVCSVIATSKDFHEKTGGIVPEIAARKQVEFIVPVIEQTLKELMEKESLPSMEDAIDSIDAIGVTVGPGLIGSLLVGIEAAKTLSYLWDKPLIPVNHLVGHLYANFVDAEKEVLFPAIGLLVSGGHTDLVLIKDHGNFEYLGGTLDDAAGEAFDKTARLLGLSKYLGAVLLSKSASLCTDNTLIGKLPRPMIDQDNFNFSFSGLKTAVKRLIDTSSFPVDVISCEFQEAVVAVLVSKTLNALEKYEVKTLLLGGGVSANALLRSRLTQECSNRDISLHIPPLSLCTDNAVYIASAAFFNPVEKDISEIEVNPSLGIMDRF